MSAVARSAASIKIVRVKNRTPRSRPLRNIVGGGDRYEVLREVLEHQAAQEAASLAVEEAARRRKPESRVPLRVAGVLLLVAAWVWIFPPSFLRVNTPRPQPLAEEEQAVRLAVFVQAERINAFRQRNDSLPATLESAGPVLPGMEYVRLGPALYQLSGATDRVRLTYRSDLPLDSFAADAKAIANDPRLSQ